MSRSWKSRRPARGRASVRRESPSCCSIRTARCWDQLLIRRGLAALERAEKLGGAHGSVRAPGVQSPPVTHARVPPDETDWARIAALYAELAQLAPSPIVELNRAVAVGDGVRSRSGP